MSLGLNGLPPVINDILVKKYDQDTINFVEPDTNWRNPAHTSHGLGRLIGWRGVPTGNKIEIKFHFSLFISQTSWKEFFFRYLL